MRKSAALLALCACIIALVSVQAFAREPLRRQVRFERPRSTQEIEATLEPGARGLYEEAAVDTYCLVWYTFEPDSWQGWTRVDNTEQDIYFHVDDFAGLGGGIRGDLVPLQGTKSMWCGARANAADPYLCSWQSAPGYGNDWLQMLCLGSCCAG